jgi:electron transfer flavoprotein beta subunit
MIIRKALAIGADAAYRIDAEPTDSEFCARQIAGFAIGKGYDMVLLGKETIDYNGSEVGPMLAGLMELPFLSHANKLEWNGTSARVQLEIEGGVEIFELELPFVLSASKGLAEQRIPNMKGIMDAKKKPLEVLPAQPVDSSVEWLRFDLPPAKTQVEMIAPDDTDRLVSVLKDELKLI